VWRLWGKGVARAWRAVVQGSFLGDAAMGFRAQTGTLHVAQLWTDLIALQRRRGEELWLVSVDLWKCYDMIRWWAIFGVMLYSGAPGAVVAVFRDFYRKLRRRFRYGQVDGMEWEAANGLPHGCSAAPDLLNMLMESFHRWAGAQEVGVVVGNRRVASVGFADDVTLVARTREEAVFLVQGYKRWCHLLELVVTKVHACCNVGVGEALEVGGETIRTEAHLKVVGVVLGEGKSTSGRGYRRRRRRRWCSAYGRWSCPPPFVVCCGGRTSSPRPCMDARSGMSRPKTWCR